MWQAPDNKRRALLEAQREAREKAKRSNGLRICRTSAQVRIPGLPDGPLLVKARVVLNEVLPEGMIFFAARELPVGALAQITLEDPRRVYVRARVESSQELSTETRVISTECYSHRVRVVFLFDSEEERDGFVAFCKELKVTLREVTLREVKTGAPKS
jgi:hypothetical protein